MTTDPEPITRGWRELTPDRLRDIAARQIFDADPHDFQSTFGVSYDEMMWLARGALILKRYGAPTRDRITALRDRLSLRSEGEETVVVDTGEVTMAEAMALLTAAERLLDAIDRYSPPPGQAFG